MKRCLSQIPESERQEYIRETARNRIMNRIKQQINIREELKRV